MPSPTICCVRSRRPSARALIAPFSEALELRTALNTAFETDRRSREGDRNAPLLPSPLLKTLECTRSPNFLTASQPGRVQPAVRNCDRDRRHKPRTTRELSTHTGDHKRKAPETILGKNQSNTDAFCR